MAIFKGLYNSLAKIKPFDSIPSAAVFPVHAAEHLLSNEKRQQAIKNIKALLNLPPKLYESLYYSVIKNFAEFVQNIPETQYGLFSHEGGFLDHGLERASRALSLCLTNFFPEEKSFQSVSSQEALWIYAVFTVALFLDIGRLAVKYKVNICDKHGSKIKNWSPFAETLTDSGNHYQYEHLKQNREQLRKHTTPLLARQLLDRNAADETLTTSTTRFNWIASDHNVLETWLTMLSGDSRSVNSFLTVIPIADAQVIEKYLTDKTTQIINQFKTSDTTNLADNKLLTDSAGEAFLAWLQNGLSDGTISVNKENSNVQVTADGVLISPTLFREFAQSQAQFTNPGLIESSFKQFLETYVISASEVGKNYYGIGGITAAGLNKFLLVVNPSLLFAHGKVPGINTQITSQPNNQAVISTPINTTKAAQHANILSR